MIQYEMIFIYYNVEPYIAYVQELSRWRGCGMMWMVVDGGGVVDGSGWWMVVDGPGRRVGGWW